MQALLKKIDVMLIKAFFPPFILTFFIALFVLVLQFLWKYIDEIVGKGLEFRIILELIFYLSTSLFVIAMPIGVLVASVMVMGGLAERYELATMKSAGISLGRIMRPLMIAGAFIGMLSFITANYVVPVSNLKFKSRLYDIRKQKPMLNIVPGRFIDEFRTTVIRVGEIDKDQNIIRDVMIYDHENRKNDNLTKAEWGEMYFAPNQQFMVMRLHNGKQYQELARSGGSGDAEPFVRTSFKTWEKMFDLSEFAFSQTDEELFKSHETMLSLRQLRSSIDSLNVRLREQIRQQQDYSSHFFHFRKPAEDSAGYYIPAPETTFTGPIYSHIDEYFRPTDRGEYYRRAQTAARSMIGHIRSTIQTSERLHINVRGHWREWHTKFTWAAACILFLFIGAPMGAIIRKGGFGWPMLISIVFFVSYIMLGTIGRNLIGNQSVSPALGSWLPVLVLLPIGILLTYKAMADSKMLQITWLTEGVQKLAQRLKNRSKSQKSYEQQA